MSAAEKTERIMGALMDHLRARYNQLSSSNVFRLQTNVSGTLTLILDLLSPKVGGSPEIDVKPPTDTSGEYQFLNNVNCGLQYLPTFQIVFTPMAIVSDQDSPPPSSRTLFNVLLVNYQGTVLRKDFMTFYVNYPPEVIEAAAAAKEAAEAEADGTVVVVEPDVELAEKSSSGCEMLENLDKFSEFRLCCGLRKNRRSQQIKLSDVYLEPFGEARNGFVVRSRDCKFMLELDSDGGDSSWLGGSEAIGPPLSCRFCKSLESCLAELGMEKLKALPRVKVEVKEEGREGRSGPTFVLPVEADEQVETADDSELMAVVDVGEDGQTRAVINILHAAGGGSKRGPRAARSRRRDSDDESMVDPSDFLADPADDPDYEPGDDGKENVKSKRTPVVKTESGKSAVFHCELCDKQFKFIDAYWKHVKRCGQPKGVQLTASQARMMVTRQNKGDKMSCNHCGRDFFHEINWKRHVSLCKSGRIKQKSVYKQGGGGNRIRPLGTSSSSSALAGGGDGAAAAGGSSKEMHECLICLKKVGSQWERHMRLHRERVGDKLNEQTVCPSWDCEEVFDNRIDLNKHFLEHHDAEAIPCVYCVRLIMRDRIGQHIRNEHPHLSHLCTECGRECIYPSALKQHIKEFHQGIRDAMCDLCGKSYQNQRALRKHMKTHAPQREYICSDCGKDFLTTTKLNEHRRVHTGAKPFQCKVCAYKAGKKENVIAHIKKVHNINTGFNDYVLIIKEEL